MKKTFIAAASLMLFAPSIALAAWWNPFTWFAPKAIPQISATSSVATTSITVISTTTPKIVQKKIIPTISNQPPITQTKVVTVPPTVAQTPVVNTPIIVTPAKTTQSICQNGYTYSSTSGCVITHPILPPTPPVLTTSQKIAALEQQIIDIKTKALQDSAAAEGNRNYSADTGQGVANQIINTANNQIEQINLRIQQLELNAQMSQ